MKDWYKEYPDLLEREIRVLKDNGILVDDANLNRGAFNREGVRLICTIPVENNLGLNLTDDLKLNILFPSNYPYFRPDVYVISGVVLPRHHNPHGKNLCLLPRPTQFWNPEDRIYKYLKERLPIVFEKGRIIDQEVIGMDPEEQAEPISEYYTNPTNAVVLSARPVIENIEVPNDEEFKVLDHGTIQISHSPNGAKVKLIETIMFGDEFLPVAVLDANSETLKIVLEKWFDTKDRVIADFPFNNFLKSEKTLRTKWYKINSLEKLLNKNDSFNWLIADLKSKGVQQPLRVVIQTRNYVINHIVGLLFPEEEVAGKIDWGWLLFVDGYVLRANDQKLRVPFPFPIVLPIMSVDRSELFVRIPHSKVLNDKTISIIGLGSLGAPSALEFAAIQAAENFAKEAGARKTIMLNVAGAFHSRLMASAAGKLEAFLVNIKFNQPRIPVVANATGMPHGGPDDMRRVMVQQVTSSVRWPLGIESAGMLKTIALKNFIEKYQPDFVLCGHVHEAAGIEDFIGKTKVINVGRNGKILEF